MEVFFHALRIEHAVVPQGHPALAIEEGHVAVKLEELPADRLAMDRQAIDDLAAEDVLADHFVQIGLILDAIEDLVGPDEHVRAVLLVAGVAGAETTADRHPHVVRGNAGGGQLLADGRFERPLALPAAALAAAGEDFVLGDLLDRPVEHVLQHRLAAQHVGGEDIVDQVSIDPFVLDRHLAGDEHADDRLAAAAAGAARAMQEDVGASRRGDVFAELVEHLVGPGGLFARGRSDLDANGTARGLIFEAGFGLVGQKRELLRYRGGHDGS